MLLRVALNAAIQHDEKGGKKVRRGKYFDTGDLPDEYRREVPQDHQVKGIEIIPPKDSDDGPEPVQNA